MVNCTVCGQANPATARFCSNCGSPLTTAAPPLDREVRKTVTVVFSDLVGSTALGERLDPEPLREVITRYYDAVAAVLTRHGGTVAKFIGDAVMAVFGVPRLREDDAVRAVRAAAELGPALDELNRELEAGWGVRLALRTGVNTGEVVAGVAVHGQDLAVGDAVNVAARLEQAAGPGEVMIGVSTWQLVRDAVTVEPAGELTLKGKPSPVSAYRLVAVRPDVPGRRRHLDTPLVGRVDELGRLRAAFEGATAARCGRLVLVTGPAGVGKTRLVEEFLATLGAGVTVLRGRCRDDGEGLTFWPLVEVVRQAAGLGQAASPEAAEHALAALFEEEEQAGPLTRQLAGMLGATAGDGSGDTSAKEFPWALRRLLTAVARRGPLVVFLDDLHWADPALLDVVEQVTETITDAPVLLCGTVRPELLDARPAWAGDGLDRIALEAFAEAESSELVDQVLGAPDLPSAAKARLWQATDGNPLFIEELIAKLMDEGTLTRVGGRWTTVADLASVPVPPTISALLAARLEQLDAGHRDLLERASVFGQVFDRAAVSVLAPEPARPRIDADLAALADGGLIRAANGDGWRFRHVLLRDATYSALPMRRRAELHERLADWLEQAGGERLTESEEVIGYHFEQAWRWRTELGPGAADGRAALARRASSHLAAAGRRALGRDDATSAVNLLGRAADLMPSDDPRWPAGLLDLSDALMEAGQHQRAGKLVSEAVAAAEARGDEVLVSRGRITRLYLTEMASPAGWSAMARREAERAIAVSERAGDALGVANGWRLIAHVCNIRLQWAELERVGERIARFAREAGDLRTRNRILGGTAAAICMGPTPVPEAIRRCTAILDELDGAPRPTVMVLDAISLCHAIAGRPEEAQRFLARADTMRADLAGTLWKVGGRADFGALVYLLLGRPDEAERILRRSYELLSGIGERGGPLATQAALLAEALFAQGSDAEAERFAELSAGAAGDHLLAGIQSRQARTMGLVRRGQLAQAEQVAREALALAVDTDGHFIHGQLWLVLAEVLRLAGRTGEAADAARQALGLFERKGAVVAAAKARALLDELGDAPQPAR